MSAQIRSLNVNENDTGSGGSKSGTIRAMRTAPLGPWPIHKLSGPETPTHVKLGKVCVDSHLGNFGPGAGVPRQGAWFHTFHQGRAMGSHSADNGTGTAGAPVSWSDKRIFTTGEAAEVCKVSQQTIIRCFDSGRLGGFRVPGSKFRRIPRADLIKFMKDNDIPTEILESGPKRVLVVDDDPAIAEMFKDLLGRQNGLDVRVCSTGYDAGLLTESFRPHLIVLDYMLPDINGNVVCSRLREREEFKDTKVIFVSGVVSQEEIDKLRQAGADDFVRKPFDVHHFMGRVKELLSV